jgi:hypothetical protein
MIVSPSISLVDDSLLTDLAESIMFSASDRTFQWAGADRLCGRLKLIDEWLQKQEPSAFGQLLGDVTAMSQYSRLFLQMG